MITPRKFACRPNFHKSHATRPHNHHTSNASCSNAHVRHKNNGHMRPYAHSHTYRPRTRRFNGHYHYCGKFGHTNYKCAIRKVYLRYGRMFDLNNDGTINPQGPKYILVPKVN